MNRKYAFIDEYGAFGYNFENSGCSSHFIISAIIVDEKDLIHVENSVTKIQEQYFPNGEIKSSKIGKNHIRRIKILNDLKKLPFHIYTFVCDKREIYKNSGLRYKASFYKFLNNYVYQELRVNFSNLIIVADEIGENDFLQSFAKYIRSKETTYSLFDESLFIFKNSKSDSIIQVADIVSGSIAYNYDVNKILNADGHDYVNILSKKILRIKQFPELFDTFNVQKKDVNMKYNPLIANICYRKAKDFIIKHQTSSDDDIRKQIAILNYLLFCFMNKMHGKYIPTKELINQLTYLGYEKLSLHVFRNKIIAKLRDNEVIIASSSEGYKIPSSEDELYDFINHGKNIIMPMLSRLKKCNDIIRMGTDGRINLFKETEYNLLANMLNNQKQKKGE